MTQNTSHAVMAQRVEAHDSLDDFPTPPWAVRALCEYGIYVDKDMSVWEPAANRGFMVRGLKDYFGEVFASDIHDYNTGFGQRDFLWEGDNPDCNWIITNPPFRLAQAFYHRSIGLANIGFALLVRTQFLEGVGRYNDIFEDCPPDEIWQFSERVPMVKGRCDGEASTATSYCWIVRYAIPKCGTIFGWIPPCRKHLERPGDYEIPESTQ